MESSSKSCSAADSFAGGSAFVVLDCCCGISFVDCAGISGIGAVFVVAIGVAAAEGGACALSRPSPAPTEETAETRDCFTEPMRFLMRVWPVLLESRVDFSATLRLFGERLRRLSTLSWDPEEM